MLATQVFIININIGVFITARVENCGNDGCKLELDLVLKLQF